MNEIEEILNELNNRGKIGEEEVRMLNEKIWQEEYEEAITPEDFARAVKHSADVEKIAEKNKFLGETMGRICLTSARLIYYRDKKAGKISKEAYEKAMKGLKHAEYLGTKVSLYNVASDTMGELIKDYNIAFELADKSCEIAKESNSDVVIGKAENNTALRYLNFAKQPINSGKTEKSEIAKDSFEEAILHFRRASIAHQKAKDNRQIGHAYSNISLCYIELSKIPGMMKSINLCNLAIENAVNAIKAYGGLKNERNKFHALGANYRMGIAFRERAVYSSLSDDLIEAVRCFTENATIYFKLGKFEKVEQELKNIAETIK